MPLKSDEPGDDVTIVHRWGGGFTWMAHPDADMQRASQALAVDSAARSSAGSRTQSGDGDVWLVDPLDAAGLDDELAALGEVAGVVVLTNSHGRHADRLARRHDVPVYVPDCFDPDATPVADLDAPVEFFDGELADTGFELVWEKDRGGWKEGALYHPERRTLVVADALMTGLFAARPGTLEVLPFFQLSPPTAALGDLDVQRILVGHGPPVVDDAEAALQGALDTTRTGAIRSIARGLPTLARQAYSEIRS